MTACRATALFLAAFLLPPALAGAEAVRFEAGRLFVHVRDAPSAAVLAAVAAETGLRFLVTREVEGSQITVAIDGAKLEEAIPALVAALPGAAGQAMVYGRTGAGDPRLVEVTIFGPGGPSSATRVVTAERSIDVTKGRVPQEDEERILALLREFKEAEAAIPAREELPPEERARVDRLVDVGFGEQEAVTALFFERQRQKLLEGLSDVPGGAEAFNAVRYRSYYRPGPAEAGPPTSFSAVWDDL